MAKKMDLDAAIDVDNPAAGDGNTDDIIEQYKKESAGKDRKVSELLNRIKELEDRDRHQPPGLAGEELTETLATLREKTGRLTELEQSLNQREQALSWAIEKGVSIPLAVGNSHRLEQFKGEVEELYENLRRGAMRGLQVNREKATGDPNRSRNIRVVDTGNALTLEHLGKMSGNELSRIPDRIRERLMGGSK